MVMESSELSAVSEVVEREASRRGSKYIAD